MEVRPISQSSLNLYRDCPYAYKLKYIDGLEPMLPSTEIFDIGTYVHTAIDGYYRNRYKPRFNPDDILAESYDELKKVWDHMLDPKKLRQAYICLKNHSIFESERVLKQPNIKPLTEVEIAENGFYGIIDYIDVENSKVIDWKTNKYANLSHSYRIQAQIYKILYESKFDKKLDYAHFLFLYPNEWRTVKFDTNLQKKISTEIDQLKEKIIESTLNNDFEKKPRVKSVCRNCLFSYYCKVKKI